MIVLWICLALSVVGAAILFAAQLAIGREPFLRLPAGSFQNDRSTREGRGEGAMVGPKLPHPALRAGLSRGERRFLQPPPARWPPAAAWRTGRTQGSAPTAGGARSGVVGAGRCACSSVPAISILKPLKGADPGLEENLESFYRLDYAEYEIIFSFASRDDEALPVARRVADRHPNVPTAFVVAAREPGRNPKVSRLLAAVTRARHPILLISDADVFVAPRYLSRSAAAFDDPLVGLVSNPFRCEGGNSAGSAIESLHMNGFVLGGTAAVSRFLKRPCVVGKSIFLRRTALDWIGGFDAVRDHLAEDFLLGDLMVRAGFRAVLSPQFVTIVSQGRTIRSFWDRQVRWARMRRRLAGTAYLAEAFASPVPWSILVVIFGGLPGAATAIAMTGLKIAADLFLLNRSDSLPSRRGASFWIAVKDTLAFGVFWAGLASDRTRWRGRSVRIGKRTLLVHSR